MQSDKQLQNHEKSRKHLDAVAALREMFIEEDRQFDDAGLEMDGDEEAELAAAFDGLATHDTTADAHSAPDDTKDDGDSDASSNEDDGVDIAAAMEHARVSHRESDAAPAASLSAAAVSTVAPPVPTPAADSDDDVKGESVSKLSAKQKREARKAKKAEKAATPSAAATAPRVINELQCQTCDEEFTSRNKRK